MIEQSSVVCVRACCEYREKHIKIMTNNRSAFVNHSREKKTIVYACDTAKVDDRWSSSSAIKWIQRTKFTFGVSVCDRIWCAIVASSCYLTMISFCASFLRLVFSPFVLNTHRFHLLKFTFSKYTSSNVYGWLGTHPIGVSENETNLFVCFQHRLDIYISVRFHTQLLFG